MFTQKIRTITILVLVTSMLALAGTTFAQDMHDPGSGDNYHPAHVNYRVGYYFQLRGDHQRAIEEFTVVVDSLPNWDGGYSARGDSLAALEQYEAALADYATALEISPNFVSVLYMRGRVHQALGDFELATGDFEAAISQAADYAPPLLGMGDLLYEQGKLTEALGYYRQFAALTDEPLSDEIIARISGLETVAVAETA